MNVPRGASFADHAFGWGQLVDAAEGVARVDTQEAAWVLPPGRALWVPGGVRHVVRCVTDVSVRIVYFPPGQPPLPARCRVIGVHPLVRALIGRLVELQGGPSPSAASSRVAALVEVLQHELACAEQQPLALPLPSDLAARRVAERILDQPGSRRSLAALCARVGASRRTVERRFQEEAGMPLGHWRRAARLHAALVELASGGSVALAADRAGYDSASAFVQAFRKAFGFTPGAARP
jgi:AraC-like DNA-binding protein